jgi:hypothetical protein
MAVSARAVPLAAGILATCVHGAPLAPVPLAVLPLDPSGGALYVPAVINGDTAWLMLDTGLSRTGIDREWAAAIGLAAAPAGAPGQDEGPGTAVLDTLRLGELALHAHPAALYPLRSLSEASGRLQRGLIGHDVLHRYVVEIDYQNLRVRLFAPAGYRHRGAGATVRFTPDADRPLLRAELKAPGGRPLPARLLLDTGASGLCLILTTPFAEQHGLDRLAPAIAAPIGTGLAGELHGTIVRLQELRLGAVRVRSPTTGVGGEYKGFLARTDIDGVIGNAVFEGARLIVDYARRRVVIEAPAAGRSRCDYDMSGLRLAAAGPTLARLVVDYVVPRSPGATAGIAAGDEVLELNGRPVGGPDLDAVRSALRVEGAVCRLTLRRGPDTLRVALALRRLL